MSENQSQPQPSQPTKRKPGRPPKQARSFEDTKLHLIQTGLVHLTEFGYFASGLDAILKAAGIPKGSFYYYFKNKDDFCHEVLTAYGQYFARKLKKHLQDPASAPLDRIYHFVCDAKRGMTKFEFKRGCLVGNLMQESPNLSDDFSPHLQQILQEWQQLIADCLKLAREAGEQNSAADDYHLAGLFWSGWEGAVMRAKLYRSAQPLEDFWTYFKASISSTHHP